MFGGEPRNFRISCVGNSITLAISSSLRCSGSQRVRLLFALLQSQEAGLALSGSPSQQSKEHAVNVIECVGRAIWPWNPVAHGYREWYFGGLDIKEPDWNVL